MGAPLDTLNGSEEIERSTERGTKTYRVIDFQHILGSKLAAFRARGDIDSNDFKDLVWILVESPYQAKVREVSDKLPIDHREGIVLALLREKRLKAPRIQRIKYLLGVP